ncbi:heavy-metal-associated domain-containing protein [Lysobacter sp. D1-1-M9]|uniref:heavy-metal-associated domain-containing protein n=1 Tax=Novilysobacter longmucuonensis TaxID=3098603 RepID=UPI002FC7E5C1
MKSILKPILIIALLGAPTVALAQGLVHAKQTIFGMDCAPCAYGIEQGLKRLPGVESVKVSLNDGYAELTLAAGSSTSMQQIRAVIRDNGFTPKEARIDLEGTLALTPTPQLIAGETRYALALDNAAGAAAGQRVKLTGVVETDVTQVQVEKIEPLPTQG